MCHSIGHTHITYLTGSENMAYQLASKPNLFYMHYTYMTLSSITVYMIIIIIGIITEEQYTMICISEN